MEREIHRMRIRLEGLKREQVRENGGPQEDPIG